MLSQSQATVFSVLQNAVKRSVRVLTPVDSASVSNLLNGSKAGRFDLVLTPHPSWNRVTEPLV